MEAIGTANVSSCEGQGALNTENKCAKLGRCKPNKDSAE
jgi:hypothetical protein